MRKVNKLLILLLLITLSVSFTGCSSKSSTKFTLTVEIEGSGQVEPAAGTHQFDRGTSVDLTATPETGWQFKEWFGEVAEPQEAETKVLMDKDKTVKAKFEEIPENTTIESINGVNDIEVVNGTSETEALSKLPVTATITDSAGGEHTVELSWSIAGYDGDTAGEYEATGSFELPDGVEQSDPPLNLEVTTTVTVLAHGSVTGVSIIEGDQELGVGDMIQLTAEVEPSDAINQNVNWSSSNPAAVTVNSSGQLEAVATGIDEAERVAVITVTTEEGNYSDQVTVTVTTHPDYFIFDNTTGTITAYNPDGGPEVVIPSVIDGVDVSIIGDEAFKSCGMTGVIIPDGVTEISYAAFCYNDLTAVEIPGSVKTIGIYAFYQNSLACLVIGDGVTTIKESAFNDNQLTYLTIPGSVNSIGNFAFENNQLTGLTLNFGLESIGHSAFAGNNQSPSDGNQLSSLIIPDSVITIEGGAFATNALESVTIGNSVESIGSSAFWYNQLEELILPDSVSSIGDYSFFHNSLSNLTIGSGLTVISESAFCGNSLSTLIIPDTVTGIESGAFNSNSLGSLVIPDSIETISAFAFANNLISELSIGGNVRVIGEKAFEDNKITQLTIPDSVEEIHTLAFHHNEINNLILGSSVNSIDHGAFRYNELTEVVLPDSVNTIGRIAFEYNPVNMITIGSNVTIYDNAFATDGSPDNKFREAYTTGDAGTYARQGDGTWEKTP